MKNDGSDKLYPRVEGNNAVKLFITLGREEYETFNKPNEFEVIKINELGYVKA